MGNIEARYIAITTTAVDARTVEKESTSVEINSTSVRTKMPKTQYMNIEKPTFLVILFILV